MPDSLAELLRWYAEMGVDIAVDPMPHDRTRERPAAAASPRASEPPSHWTTLQPPTASTIARSLSATVAPAEAVELAASEAATSAQTLAELREHLFQFEGCGLKATATQLVFGSGGAGAHVMLVGEAPGADEDRQGIPFVGRAGQLLDKMLAAIGLDRGSVYIANIVPWRPPGNRTPTPLETATCLPFIRRQIELVGPKILVCLGAPSAQTLLASKEGITRLRGRWFDYAAGEAVIRAMPMLHPAYLLRRPADKRLAWRDLRLLAAALLDRPLPPPENSA